MRKIILTIMAAFAFMFAAVPTNTASAASVVLETGYDYTTDTYYEVGYDTNLGYYCYAEDDYSWAMVSDY